MEIPDLTIDVRRRSRQYVIDGNTIVLESGGVRGCCHFKLVLDDWPTGRSNRPREALGRLLLLGASVFLGMFMHTSRAQRGIQFVNICFVLQSIRKPNFFLRLDKELRFLFRSLAVRVPM